MTDVRFKSPCSLMLAAPSQSGKTTLTFRLLKNIDEMFTGPKIHKIVYCYGAYQNKFSDVGREIGKYILFVKGFPGGVDVRGETWCFSHR